MNRTLPGLPTRPVTDLELEPYAAAAAQLVDMLEVTGCNQVTVFTDSGVHRISVTQVSRKGRELDDLAPKSSPHRRRERSTRAFRG